MKTICFLETHSPDAIFREIRGQMQDFIGGDSRFNQNLKLSNSPGSDIIVLSAGDPYWRDPKIGDHLVGEILGRAHQKLVIIERHEYGWGSYASPIKRANTAHMGVPDYGKDIEAGGQNPHNEGWYNPLSRLVREMPKDRLLYFRREFYEGFDYPDWVHPTNFPLGPSPEKFSREQFGKRPLDVMCIWGETHPHRKIIGDALKGAVAQGWIKGDIRSPVYNGDPGRLGGGEGYRGPHESARIFITSDGHGLGGGREWELLTTSVMMRKRSWMKFPHDFIDGEMCLMFGDPLNPDPDGMIRILRDIKDDHDRLYGMYSRAYEHSKKHHTCAARCGDILWAAMNKGWI